MLKDPVQTIGNLIDKQNVCFLSGVDEEGFPTTKAMLMPRVREGIRLFFLSTNTSSMRVEQFKKNNKACLYFMDRRFFRGVMLQGTVEVLHDAGHKELIWQDGDEQYYPLGVSDPDYCVLLFVATSGRYYANFKSKSFAVESES